jgi:hypothetical protein
VFCFTGWRKRGETIAVATRGAPQGDGSLRKIQTIRARSRKRRNRFCTSRR